MSARYRVIMYERQTDRVGGIIDVPAYLEPQALAASGIHDPAELGEVELHDQQVRALAALLNFRQNTGRYIYHFETVTGTRDPLRA
jgi:hypothetical protein